MVVKRVMLLWVLAALAVGSVFLRCGGRDVDEPMKWKNAWEVPVNYSVPVGNTLYDEVYAIVNKGIVDAVPKMDLEGQDSLTSIILGDTSNIVGSMMDDDFEQKLLQFMKENQDVKALLEKDRLNVDSVAAAVAGQTDSFREQVSETFDDDAPFRFSLEPMVIPALNIDAIKAIENPKINIKFGLDNRTPLSFTLYMLFFEEINRPEIDALADDAAFVEFIERLDNNDANSGYINFFYDRRNGKKGLEIGKSERKSAPDLSERAVEQLSRLVTGTEPLVWKWLAVVYGKPDEILGVFGDMQEFSVNAELSIKIEGTNNFDSLFGW